MTFLKKTVLAPFTFAAVLASVQAVAESSTHTIKLAATIPSADFYVLPNDSSWIGDQQPLTFNASTGDLGTLSKGFNVININGPISARLLNTPVITGEKGSIDLVVKFGEKVLGTVSQEVVTAEKAAEASSVNLSIAAVKPANGFTPGEYTGNVQLSFDAEIGE